MNAGRVVDSSRSDTGDTYYRSVDVKASATPYARIRISGGARVRILPITMIRKGALWGFKSDHESKETTLDGLLEDAQTRVVHCVPCPGAVGVCLPAGRQRFRSLRRVFHL